MAVHTSWVAFAEMGLTLAAALGWGFYELASLRRERRRRERAAASDAAAAPEPGVPD